MRQKEMETVADILGEMGHRRGTRSRNKPMIVATLKLVADTQTGEIIDREFDIEFEGIDDPDRFEEENEDVVESVVDWLITKGKEILAKVTDVLDDGGGGGSGGGTTTTTTKTTVVTETTTTTTN
jgi:hypothetical protein